MIVDHICVNFGAKLYQELFNTLQNRSIEQNVFYPRNKKHRIVEPDRPYRIDSALVLDSSTKISFTRKRRIMRQHYDPLFHRNKPDIIHAHTLFSDGSLAYYYSKKFNTPFVVAIRSTDIDVFLKFKPWLSRYGKQILKNAKYIFFISPSLQKKFQLIFGSGFESKSLVIPNGINQSFFRTEEPRKRNPHAPVELVYVGSFQKLKNVPTLIKLVEKLNARLTIVGKGGSEEKKVLQLIQKISNVKYIGHVEDQSKLTQIYRQSDIFVMTSKRETFGLVYLEAMSQGLPVIYSKNTGIDGLFEQGTIGYGVIPGSVSEMAKAIEKIQSDYSHISNNCINEARNFNWTSIAEKYQSLYSKIISSSEQEQL